ncbi:MAG: hypothetical protein ACRDNW_02115 [Trebonia sp.]
MQVRDGVTPRRVILRTRRRRAGDGPFDARFSAERGNRDGDPREHAVSALPRASWPVRAANADAVEIVSARDATAPFM